jgi:mRNA-degrading endonuclease RelE of RelBE toxin-antitoxin system
MRTKIKIGPLAENFIKSLSPLPKRALKVGIKGLEKDTGDLKQLEGRLAGYSRLRVGRIRVIFKAESLRGERVIFCVFINFRPVVYELFEQLLASGLIEELKQN